MVAVACVLWGVAVAGGFAGLWRYKSAPGAQGAAPLAWPAAAGLRLHSDRATLLMFAHPQCACTRASLAELARLMARLHDRVSASVVFAVPRDGGESWARTDLWSSAARIPGVSVQTDEGGVEATRFGVATSGGVVLYDRRGSLLFRGGITSARGHEGNSFGTERITSLLTRGAADRPSAPVFGCALAEEKDLRLAQARMSQTHEVRP